MMHAQMHPPVLHDNQMSLALLTFRMLSVEKKLSIMRKFPVNQSRRRRIPLTRSRTSRSKPRAPQGHPKQLQHQQALCERSGYFPSIKRSRISCRIWQSRMPIQLWSSKWKNLGKWPLPCQMVFVLKPLTQTQQTADDADQDYKHKSRFVICGNFAAWGEQFNSHYESRCSTLAIDAQSSMCSRYYMV